MDWCAVQNEQRCGRCRVDDRNVKVELVPFGRNDAELRARRAAMLMMNLALLVLKDAAARAKKEDVCTPAVRLALRVLRPHLADRELLVTFWTEVGAASGASLDRRGIGEAREFRVGGVPVIAEVSLSAQ